ncbi:arsenical pump-driving ATPase [Alkalihalobacillus sp. LMS39]|uniref:arsenical pump-driving ATPase n=1 Tax=Alkalihalobacillus sp. LMS39 TaxID=2924032 RepID=UPI001FB46F6E|nr:arsenical pump-driving ATPase [Alkalihalobacillus sp. LMS39]UOE94324.1 arsenical pump-driving ATPase [Alkalihalobacillus sp. LMS39]
MRQRFLPAEMEMTRYLFFTGKGGVGKTSTACATALQLAEVGKKVLIVSTDPASNLQDVFRINIDRQTTAIPNVDGLFAININPEQVAAQYRESVIGPYRDKLPAPVIMQMEEQLSGACTVEIAAFNEFADVLTNEEIANQYDHIIFDTAPTGHTLRLLQLPTAWSQFLEESTHGASCLGPLSGLAEKKHLYNEAVNALADKEKTTLLLVTRPDKSAIQEANRASDELFDIGLQNQWVIINGKMQRYEKFDEIAKAFYNRQEQALETLTGRLLKLPTFEIPFVSYEITGTEALRVFFKENKMQETKSELQKTTLPPLSELLDTLAKKQSGVVMTMGKGGVGKTTIASAIAIGLAEQGHQVHLTTTDPAAHLSHVFGDEITKKNLQISVINPEVEVEEYKEDILSKAKEALDEDGLAYLKEDLHSPCTEEIAVFQAFAKVVDQGENQFVVIDTAPTGHTLLLLDAAQSYQKEVTRTTGEVPKEVERLLPRLRDKRETDVVIVTLPEATPYYEAKRLADDLKRAEINPTWTVINQSFALTTTTDPILKQRATAEWKWIEKIQTLTSQTVITPWQIHDTIGYSHVKELLT